MTEVVPKTAEAADRQGLARISHWIGGRIVPGESGRRGPVFNPALGRQTAEAAGAWWEAGPCVGSGTR